MKTPLGQWLEDYAELSGVVNTPGFIYRLAVAINETLKMMRPH